MKLIDFLAANTDDSLKRGVWVNPDNPDEFRIGKLKHYNGGLADGWVFIGTMMALRFGIGHSISEYQVFKDSLPFCSFKGGPHVTYTWNDYIGIGQIEGDDLVTIKFEMDRLIRDAAMNHRSGVKRFVEVDLPKILTGELPPYK